jgi:sugar-specific transcriptional regulator TrmB
MVGVRREQLMDELRSQFDTKLKEMKRQYDRAESEFENARSQWRVERRGLHEQIEKLETALDKAKESIREEITSDLSADITFQLERPSAQSGSWKTNSEPCS